MIGIWVWVVAMEVGALLLFLLFYLVSREGGDP